MKPTELEANSQGSAEIISVRAEAPRDVCEKIQEILAAAGFSTSGMRPRVEGDGTWRFYFTSPTAQFRQTHALVDLDTSDVDAKAELEIVAAETILPQLRKDQTLLQSKLGETQKELGRCTEDPLRRNELKDHQQKLVNEIHLLNQSIDDKQRITNRRPGLEERKKRLAIMRDMIAHPPECQNCGSPTRLRSPPDWLRHSLEALEPSQSWLLQFSCTRPPLECGKTTTLEFPPQPEKKHPHKKISVTDGYLPAVF